MKDLVNKLKNIKNVTQSQYEDVIKSYSHTEVLKELKKAGLTKDDMSASEFEELIEEKIKESKQFSKGAMAAGGAFLFLEFLG